MTLLVNLAILLVVAIVVFMVVKYVLTEAEADPALRKIVLLILLIVFLIGLMNVLTGYTMWPAFYQPTTTVHVVS